MYDEDYNKSVGELFDFFACAKFMTDRQDAAQCDTQNANYY